MANPTNPTLNTFLNLRKVAPQAPLAGGRFQQPQQSITVPKAPVAPKVVSKPKQKRRRKPVQDPLLQLDKLVQEHNDYIYGNDLDDRTIPYVEYFNKNSPSFLDGNESIGEELKYVQNRLWKLQGDGRYVPDYEDTETMSDQEFSDYMDKLGMATQEDNLSVPAIDDLSDQDFEHLLNQY